MDSVVDFCHCWTSDVEIEIVRRMPVPSTIASLIHRPVGVLGYGVSGAGVVALLRKYGVDYVIYDERGGENIVLNFEPQAAAQHDVVVYSPGFALHHPWLCRASDAGCQLLGELDFAALFWEGELIAVTGTNGKTTLTEFLTFALQRQGIQARSAGNVGYPLSQLLAAAPPGVVAVVCEVSSFQAERLNYFSPDAVLWTNFAEDHLERHGDMQKYFDAKWQLVERLVEGRQESGARSQKDKKLVVGMSVAAWAERLGKALPAYAAVVDRDAVAHEAPPGCSFDNYPQCENYGVARRYWQLQGYAVSVLQSAAQQFCRPPHRLERVAVMGDVSFWNDSKATNFAATLAALKTFAEPVYWIGGGKKKGGDSGAFAQHLAGHIEAAFLIGESAPDLQSYLVQNGICATTFVSIRDALTAAFEQAAGRGAIVLSPGFSSQDQFTDFTQRGVCFTDAVLSLQHHQ